MSRRLPAPALVLALAFGLGACKGHVFHAPDRAEQVAEADSAYAPVLFDSIHWPSEAGRLLAGNEVYARKCDKCHGPLGAANTAYAREQHLAVPSLVREDWALADNLEAVRHRIFVGHVKGMPTWGVAELSPREIDAVTAYVLLQLRPDVLKTAAKKR